MKKSRRTLKDIKRYPEPEELLDRIRKAKGWKYKYHSELMLKRDRALVCLLYLAACRISEVLRLTKNQFDQKEGLVVVSGIKLSKRKKKPVDPEKLKHYRPPKHLYREAWLPLTGRRKELTQYVLDYLAELKPSEQLFTFDRHRGWQIVTGILGEPPHWERAYGEDYLYGEWDHDIMAVSDYVKVDARTLQEYLRKGYQKYKPT